MGPNGAGKSTLFKAMVGLLPLRRGRCSSTVGRRRRIPRPGGLRAAAGRGRLAFSGDGVRRGGHGALRAGTLAAAAVGRRPRGRPGEPGAAWASPSWPSGPSVSSPGASSRGSSSPGRWRRSRTCCCWTSPSPGWISPPERPPSDLLAGTAGALGHGAGLDPRPRSGRGQVRPGGPAERAAHQRRQPERGLHRRSTCRRPSAGRWWWWTARPSWSTSAAAAMARRATVTRPVTRPGQETRQSDGRGPASQGAREVDRR